MTALYRLSGAGNDFLAWPGLGADDPPGAEAIRSWCRRGVALGADGLFVLGREGHGVRMVHYNADGSRGALCLNGSRCAVQLAHHLGWHRAGHLTLLTDAGALEARRIDERTVALELPAMVGRPERIRLEVDDRRWEAWSIEVGVPHVVLPWEGALGSAPVATLGPALRSHPALAPEGANINFVRWADDPGADRAFELRTFERGVEAETLACGTGVVASAAVGAAEGRLRLPVRAQTAGGFVLEIGGTMRDDRLAAASLRGDARILARVETTPQALDLPEPTRWRP